MLELPSPKYRAPLVTIFRWNKKRRNNPYIAVVENRIGCQKVRDKYPGKKILFGTIGRVGEYGRTPQMIRESLT
jgi:hypothetical protein